MHARDSVHGSCGVGAGMQTRRRSIDRCLDWTGWSFAVRVRRASAMVRSARSARQWDATGHALSGPCEQRHFIGSPSGEDPRTATLKRPGRSRWRCAREPERPVAARPQVGKPPPRRPPGGKPPRRRPLGAKRPDERQQQRKLLRGRQLDGRRSPKSQPAEKPRVGRRRLARQARAKLRPSARPPGKPFAVLARLPLQCRRQRTRPKSITRTISPCSQPKVASRSSTCAADRRVGEAARSSMNSFAASSTSSAA